MPDHAVTTISRLFLRSCRAFRKPDRMLVKKGEIWTRISTGEIEAAVRRLSLGLRELGLQPGDRVAILSENRPEWVLADFAVLCAGGVTVPIYTSLLPDQVRFIIADSGAKIAVCSDLEMWRKVAAVRDALPALERIVIMDGDPPAGTQALSDVEEMGLRVEPGGGQERFEAAIEAVRPGDLASIIYTSGTTGLPKGVMLSHANFVANVDSLTEVIDFRETDTALSFLPLSHVFERTATFLFFHVGTSVAYAESVEAVAANMAEVRPTVMISVPRLFEKIYARVMDQVMAGSRLKRAIFLWALATGKKHAARMIAGQPIPVHLFLKRAIANRLVFSKITARTGGRIRYMICGGAALSQDITAFFLALGLLVFPGYGLTETSPVLTGNTPGRIRLGTAGKAIPRVELRIAEDGEILARGPNVMMGYYKNEADTREALKDGWLHTGDIGRLDEDGYLIITDRKKDIIVTSGGKNIAPQPIESLILGSPFIANAVVVGSSRKFISALVVPNFEKLEAWAKRCGIAVADRAKLSRLPAVAAFLLGEINRLTPGLASYERVKKIAVLDRDFELDLGEVTPTLKVRRNFVERKYADIIDSLYQA
ncbi:MAG: long-chain fatty acid--CoA ligase [Acidobacteriota bacterium]